MENTPITILIVEDDVAIAELVEVSLKPDGYFFRRAFDGKRGLEAVKREKPALIMMDVMMPAMDGYTAASMLASDPEARDIPVIILTAKRAMRDAFTLSPNIVDFIEKPFDPEALRVRVRRVLEACSR